MNRQHSDEQRQRVWKYPPISDKLPAFMHGADYNPDQWLHRPDIVEDDVRLMKLAGCNVMAVGIFAWSALEPEEGRFEFAWLDQTLDRLAAADVYVWLATPSGARPAWMAEKYPEVLRVDSGGVRHLFGARHNHCFSSPVYREKTAAMNARLAERYAFHPAVIGWHISNEYGGECHCGYCQQAFRDWLRKKYGSLERLNHAWWNAFWSHTYSDWPQIHAPAARGERLVHGMNVDWRRFVTDQTVDFCTHEIAPLRAANPLLPVTTNMMDWFEGLDYRKFADVLDVISWDAYPMWHAADSDADVAAWFAMNHDLFRSLKGGRPFMLMESTPSLTNWQPVSKLKRPGMHMLSSLQAVAHGADTVQYFQWRKSRGASEKLHGAVVDHCGHEHTRVFRDVAELGALLAELGEVLGTAVPAQTALLLDWDNRWAVNDAQGPRNAGLGYERTVAQHYRPFWEAGIPVDIIGSADDFSRYKLIVAPMLYMVSEETGQRIEQFVEHGGVFAATYWSGVVDEHDLCHLGGFPGPLRRTLGIWAEEMDGLHDHDVNGVVFAEGNALGIGGCTYEARELCELVHAEGAEVLAAYRDDFYAGRPAATVNALGAGRAYYIAARIADPAFYAAWYGALASGAGVRRAMETELPPGVTAQVRSDGESDYIFLMNFSGRACRVGLDERDYRLLPGDGPVDGMVELAVNGTAILKAPSRCADWL